jgi:hypothetical protein
MEGERYLKRGPAGVLRSGNLPVFDTLSTLEKALFLP